MTGVVMVKDMMTLITGIHEEICFETWKKDVTMAIWWMGMDVTKTVELKMGLSVKMKLIEFLLNVIVQEQELRILMVETVLQEPFMIVHPEIHLQMNLIQVHKMEHL